MLRLKILGSSRRGSARRPLGSLQALALAAQQSHARLLATVAVRGKLKFL